MPAVHPGSLVAIHRSNPPGIRKVNGVRLQVSGGRNREGVVHPDEYGQALQVLHKMPKYPWIVIIRLEDKKAHTPVRESINASSVNLPPPQQPPSPIPRSINRSTINGRVPEKKLSNPISGQTVKLPAIAALPDPDVNLILGRGQVSRVVLSSSPLEDGCRALISFGPKDRLAFCSPRAAAAGKWTPIGDLRLRYEDCEYTWDWISDRDQNERNYEDFVYSKRHDLFFCITERNTEVEAWDLRNPFSPTIHWKLPHGEDLRFAYPDYYWPGRTEKERSLIDKCFHPKYLIFSDSNDQLFVVVRHVVPRLRPDGSAATPIYFFGYTNPWDTRYPYKTVEFDVFKVDRESGQLSHMEGSLDGLAVPASEYPGMKPDSIYFTDEDRLITPTWLARTSFGGHDNGVYDYREKSISPCYYPVEYDEIRRIVPPPVWFTPTE